jgi:hypothetical protein
MTRTTKLTKASPKTPAMRVIYDHQGPATQGFKSKMIVDIEGRRYQAWISLDTHYRSQSRAEVQLFVPEKGFTTILAQPGTENAKVKHYDGLQPVQQGDLERQNRMLPMLREGCVDLITLAHSIVKGAL